MKLLEGGWVPDFIIRRNIRKLLQQRLDEETMHFDKKEWMLSLLKQMSDAPIAIEAQSANEQHYEVAASFYEQVLGPHLKYSCCFWEASNHSLNKAEEDAMAITCQRAGLSDGMDILELGCGWGSLTLFMAQNFPNAKITAVSNSASQRQFIKNRCLHNGLENVQVITEDMNAFHATAHYDRIVSVEMFEHMRNWTALLDRISEWLKPDGKMFMHIFTHRTYTYFFEDKNENDWMSRYFFSGGIMPSESLLSLLDSKMAIEEQWNWSGIHYQKTAEEWLKNMTRSRGEVLPILEEIYGRKDLKKWWNYWRVFFMACAELWGYNNGEEWTVSHYLLTPASKP